MKQITEDYCSFEIAKLLKEKGFDGECRMTYREHDMQMIYYTPNPNNLLDFTTNRKKLEKHSKKQHCDYALCPTHQMALKWLREVHNIHIEIYRTACGYLYIVSNIPYGTDLYNPEYGGDDENSGQWTTYEKAVEAALLYVLKNLI